MTDQQKLQAVVFDWAGTIIDFGSCAPMGAFVRLFERYGIDLQHRRGHGGPWAWPSGTTSMR